MKKDLLSMLDVRDDIDQIFKLTKELKEKLMRGEPHELLKNKTLGMIFEKSSTRTRVSFEVGMAHLGGHALYLSPKDLQMGRGETIQDTGRVLSRYLDGIMYRAFDYKMVKELAASATIPVINGLDNMEHPCQILADLFTVLEKKKKLHGLTMAYVGDGNNVCNSLALGCAIVGMNFRAGCPEGYDPNRQIWGNAKEIAAERGCSLSIVRDPKEAVRDADVVYTDVWVSMGDEAEKEKRETVFKPYQVNAELMKHAKPDAIFMHCLPAHRGYEVTDEVADSPQSVIFDEAENRMHVQKAIMVMLMGKK